MKTTTFFGGPANGVRRVMARHPTLLRVAVRGCILYFLDGVHDDAIGYDTVNVYALYRDGTYHFAAIQPDNTILCDEDAWRRWSMANLHLAGVQAQTA